MDKTFYSEIGKKSGKVRRQKAVENYYKNPRICEHCGKIIDVRENERLTELRKRKFCSKECFSLSQKQRMSGNTLNKKYDKTCLYCGNKITGNKKFCNHKCNLDYRYKIAIEKWKNNEFDGMRGDSGLSDYIIKYMRNKHNNCCMICGWNQINKFTNKVPLEVHHIDGNYKNNDENNLMLLCPNCHSLTETYKGANKGNGREYRYNT